MKTRFVLRMPQWQVGVGIVGIMLFSGCSIWFSFDDPVNIVWIRVCFGFFIALGIYLVFDVLLWRVEAYETEFVVRNWLGRTKRVSYANVRALARNSNKSAIRVLDADGKVLFRVDYYLKDMDKFIKLATEKNWQMGAAAQRRERKEADIWDFETRPNYVFLVVGIFMLCSNGLFPVLLLSVYEYDVEKFLLLVLLSLPVILIGLYLLRYYFCMRIVVRANVFSYSKFWGGRRQCMLEEFDYVQMAPGKTVMPLEFVVRGKYAFGVGPKFFGYDLMRARVLHEVENGRLMLRTKK